MQTLAAVSAGCEKSLQTPLSRGGRCCHFSLCAHSHAQACVHTLHACTPTHTQGPPSPSSDPYKVATVLCPCEMEVTGHSSSDKPQARDQQDPSGFPQLWGRGLVFLPDKIYATHFPETAFPFPVLPGPGLELDWCGLPPN